MCLPQSPCTRKQRTCVNVSLLIFMVCVIGLIFEDSDLSGAQKLDPDSSRRCI